METVEVLIRLPKDTFDAVGMLHKFIDDGHIINGHHMKGSTFGTMLKAIANGTVLPKGHGRLIDADELKKYKYHDENRYENAVAIAQVDWMPTILEADKEVENGTDR